MIINYNKKELLIIIILTITVTLYFFLRMYSHININFFSIACTRLMYFCNLIIYVMYRVQCNLEYFLLKRVELCSKGSLIFREH